MDLSQTRKTLADEVNETGNSVRAGERKERRREEFLNQMIKFSVRRVDGTIPDGCTWVVSRRKMKMSYLRDLISRSTLPDVVIEYFVDSTGEIVWPEDMMLQCKKSPYEYFVVPRNRLETFDVKMDPHYTGDTIVTLRNVPLRTVNADMIVTVAALRTWLVFGMIEEDRMVKRAKAVMEQHREGIAQMEARIKRQARTEVFDGVHDQEAMKDLQEADRIRQELYDELVIEKEELERRLHEVEMSHDAIVQSCKDRPISLVQVATDDISETATWNAVIACATPEEAEETADGLVTKQDWPAIKLAMSGTDPEGNSFPPWAGRGDVPDGTKKFLPDYTDFKVNAAGMRVCRVQHGFGTHRAVDRQSVSFSSDRFSFYHGQWENGVRAGYGMEVTDEGIYNGQYKDDLRHGQGRLAYGNGDVLHGKFNKRTTHGFGRKAARANPYLNGLPHGQVEITFADGGHYRGQMVHGRITGTGKYTSAVGEVREGHFRDGQQVGSGSYITLAGEEFQGTFRDGEMNGLISMRTSDGSTFRGSFRDNYKHGRGDHNIRGKAVYSGMYFDGTRCGRGDLDYGQWRSIFSKSDSERKQREAERARTAQSMLLGELDDTGNPVPAAAGSERDGGDQADSAAELVSGGRGAAARRKRAQARKRKAAGTAAASTAAIAAAASGNAPGEEDEAKEKADREREHEKQQLTALMEMSQRRPNPWTYAGFWVAGSVSTGGTNTYHPAQTATPVAPRSLQCFPRLARIREKEEREERALRKRYDKFRTIERAMRIKMEKTKGKMFRQQRHWVKKALKKDDVEMGGAGVEKADLRARQVVRHDRLERLNTTHNPVPEHARVPTLRIEPAPVTHLNETIQRLKQIADKEGREYRPDLMVRIVASDFEEVEERQKGYRYDEAWERVQNEWDKKHESSRVGNQDGEDERAQTADTDVR